MESCGCSSGHALLALASGCVFSGLRPAFPATPSKVSFDRLLTLAHPPQGSELGSFSPPSVSSFWEIFIHFQSSNDSPVRVNINLTGSRIAQETHPCACL